MVLHWEELVSSWGIESFFGATRVGLTSTAGISVSKEPFKFNRYTRCSHRCKYSARAPSLLHRCGVIARESQRAQQRGNAKTDSTELCARKSVVTVLLGSWILLGALS
jgi:hypothetical protein